jgi:hypothetical protein
MVLFVLPHLLHPSQIVLHVIFKSFFKKSTFFLQGVQGRPGGASRGAKMPHSVMSIHRGCYYILACVNKLVTKEGKERYESRQGKVQRQLRKGTKAGKGQLRKGTK